MKKKYFFLNGYSIIRNVIPKKLILDLQNSFSFDKLKKSSSSDCYKKFLSNIKKNKNTNFDFVKPFHEISIYRSFYKKLFHIKRIHSKLNELLGPDLAYLDDPSFTLNVSGLNDQKKNYHFKKFHQEMWSGANTSTLVFWSPIFLPSNKSGQLSIIKESHLWGLIPNNNKEPTRLPSKYKKIDINLNVGDVIIFHPLLLHATNPVTAKNESARLSLVTSIRNFKNINSSYDLLKNWKIFSMSEATLIEKKLGNHYLTTYRTKLLD